MNILEECNIDCPCCGEAISVLIDCSISAQSYVEDCQVCCQPLVLDVAVSGDTVDVTAVPENG